MPDKQYYTEALGRALQKAAKTVNPYSYHVITGVNNSWQVVKEGNKRATRVFLKQHSAIDYARRILKGKNGQIFVHTGDGGLQSIINAA